MALLDSPPIMEAEEGDCGGGVARAFGAEAACDVDCFRAVEAASGVFFPPFFVLAEAARMDEAAIVAVKAA